MLALIIAGGFLAHVAYLTIHCPIGLSGDEAHYWDWSRQLDWSYYSKGPAIAYVIRAGCLLFGDTMFGVRFPALVLAAGTSLATYWLTLRVFASQRLALGAVLLCHLVPLFLAGSMLMTIDAPFYFCWAVATCLGYRATIDSRRGAWPLAGVFVGLGFLCKYAALLWLVCLLVFLVLNASQRRWLRTPWPWLTVLVAAAFTTPVIVWNEQHHWVTLGHVVRSTTENQSHFRPLQILRNFGALIGGQIGLVNPIIAGFMVGGIRLAMKRRSDARLGYLLAMSLPFFVMVSLVTLFKDAEPNWPAPTYFALMPLAAAFVAEAGSRARGWLLGAIMIGLAAMFLMHESGLLYPLIKLPPRKWDASVRLKGGQDLGRFVSAELRRLGPGAFVLSDKYQTTALLAFYVDGQPRTYCMGAYIQDPAERDRLSQYNIWADRSLDQPRLLAHNAVYVGHDQPDLARAFDRIERLPDLPIVRHGIVLRTQGIWVCHGFKGMHLPNDGLTKH
ncbi:MAG: glycosyltransferase family 39 protein [Tepidisphaeraceae bacterium]